METAKFCITKDTEQDMYLSLPYLEPKLPDWKKIAVIYSSVEIPITEIRKAMEAYKIWNQELVNKILSNHVNPL